MMVTDPTLPPWSYRRSVEVATETGQVCVVEVVHDILEDTYTVAISGVLVDRAPEGITATVQLVMLEMAAWRRSGRRRVEVRADG